MVVVLDVAQAQRLESISKLDREAVGLRVIPWPLIELAQAVFFIEFNDSAPFRIDHVQVGKRQNFVAIPNLKGLIAQAKRGQGNINGR